MSDSLQALTYTVGAQSISGALSTVEEEDVTPRGSPRLEAIAETESVSAERVHSPVAQSALSVQRSEPNGPESGPAGGEATAAASEGSASALPPVSAAAGPVPVVTSAIVPFRDGETRSLVTSLSVEAPDGRGRVTSAYSWNADTNTPRLDAVTLQELLEEARREGVTYLPPSSLANFQLASEDTELYFQAIELEQSRHATPAPDADRMSDIPETEAEATAFNEQIEAAVGAEAAGVRPPSVRSSVSAARTLTPTNGTSYPMPMPMAQTAVRESESWRALQPERVLSAREQVANRLLNGRQLYSPPATADQQSAPASKPGTPLRAPLPPLTDAQQLLQSHSRGSPLPADSAALPNIRRGGVNVNTNSVTISVPSTPGSSRSASSRYNS